MGRAGVVRRAPPRGRRRDAASCSPTGRSGPGAGPTTCSSSGAGCRCASCATAGSRGGASITSRRRPRSTPDERRLAEAAGSRHDRARLGRVDLGEEPQHRVVERVRRLGHQTVRGAAQHVEARRGDQLGQLLRVAERRERVLRAGDHERGRGDRVQLGAHVVGHREDRVDLRGERLRLGLHEHAGEHVHEHAEPALQPRADEPAHAVVGERGHAVRRHLLAPLGEQLAAPRVVPARRAREHERVHTVRVHDAEDLRDHAAHRRADHVGARDAFRVEHLDRVLRHAHEVVRTGRRVGVPGAAVVDRDAAVVAAERAALERPTPGVHAEPLDHQHGRAVAGAPGVVRDAHAVARDDLAH